jgi:serine phosphatase RsbU (regulator of sigma subunit)
MIGNTLLNEIVISKKISDPGEILSQLDIGVKRALKQLTGEIETNDGMDIAICCYDQDDSSIRYAGANRSLLICTSKELKEIRSDKKPVGGAFHAEGSYTTHELTVAGNEMIYLFTDGYADQFGGPEGKKFMVKQLKLILSKIYNEPCSAQKLHLQNEFLQWKGDLGQVDDILIVGFRA